MKKNAVFLIVFLLLDALLCYRYVPELFQREIYPQTHVFSSFTSPSDSEESETQSETLVLTTESAKEILALARFSNLSSIDATRSHEYDALLQLQEKLPRCSIRWNYEFQGQSYPNTTRALKVSSLAGLEDAIRYLPRLQYVDLIDTNATVEDLDRYDAIHPGLFYYWSFLFDNIRIRTDIQVFSTLRNGSDHRYTAEELYPILKYCRHLRALDLGHNALTDISLIGELRDLEVLILADNPITDASPLGKLTKLSYLELPMCSEIQDFSFLNTLTRLQELNLCYASACTSLSFLENMPGLTFGSFKYSGISSEEFVDWQARLPEATLVFWDGEYDSYSSGWRDTERYHQISHAFSHWRNVTDYRGVGDLDLDLKHPNYS